MFTSDMGFESFLHLFKPKKGLQPRVQHGFGVFRLLSPFRFADLTGPNSRPDGERSVFARILLVGADIALPRHGLAHRPCRAGGIPGLYGTDLHATGTVTWTWHSRLWEHGAVLEISDAMAWFRRMKSNKEPRMHQRECFVHER